MFCWNFSNVSYFAYLYVNQQRNLVNGYEYFFESSLQVWITMIGYNLAGGWDMSIVSLSHSLQSFFIG